MNKLRLIAAVICITFILVSVLIPLASSDWLMFHSDLSRDGVGTGNSVLSSKLLWKYTSFPDGNGQVYSSPAIVNGAVYIGTDYLKGISRYNIISFGSVCALNAANGETLWNYTLGAIRQSSPAVSFGVVYIGSMDRNVYALNAANGNQLWNYTTGGAIYSSPAVANGIVYIGSTDGNVYALNAATGVKLWISPAGPISSGTNPYPETMVYSSPAVVNGVLYIGAATFTDGSGAHTYGGVYALNAVNGNKIWNYTTSSYIHSSPTVVGGVVYICSMDGQVYAINAATGIKVWNYKLPIIGGVIQSSPAVAYGIVYLGANDGNVYAINAYNGYQLWKYTTGDPTVQITWSSPAIVDGVVYIGYGFNATPQSINGSLCALDAYTGTKLWNYTTDDTIDSSPAISNGLVCIGSADGNVYAFGVSPTPTSTPSPTPTSTPSPTPTTSPSPMPSSTPTSTPTLTPSPRPSPTLPPTPTPSPAPSPTTSPTASPTPTPSPTTNPTPTTTPTSTPTPTPSPTLVPTTTASTTQTITPTPIPNLTLTPTSTSAPSQTQTTPTPTAKPSVTSTPTQTQTTINETGFPLVYVGVVVAIIAVPTILALIALKFFRKRPMPS